MAFARLFPIDAVNAQDNDRTSSELNLSDGTSCGSPHGPNDCGDLPRSPRSSSALTASPHVRKTRRNLSLHNDAVPRTIQTVSRTSATPVLGGLHYQYFRA